MHYLFFPLDTQPRAKLFCAHDFCKICASKKTHNINILVYPLKIHKPPGIKTCNLGVLHLRMDFSLLNLQKEKKMTSVEMPCMTCCSKRRDINFYAYLLKFSAYLDDLSNC